MSKKGTEITVYGASDDLIELDGGIREEFDVGRLDGPVFVTFSNGAVLEIEYDWDGIWRIRPVSGSSFIDIEHCDDSRDTSYSDVAVIKKPAKWAALSSRVVKA